MATNYQVWPRYPAFEKTKEKNVAGITKIGQHEVTEIKRDAAQVGCTKVTRAEVEELLKKMDAAPKKVEGFQINREAHYHRDFISFTVRNPHTGWLAARESVESEWPGAGFSDQAAHFCLEKQNAQALFEFLGGALGHDSYTSENGSYHVKFMKV